MSNIIPIKSLITIYKSFIRTHLDYAGIVYDHPNNKSFNDRIEKVQYDACLAITGTFNGTSRECVYGELGLESLKEKVLVQKNVVFL